MNNFKGYRCIVLCIGSNINASKGEYHEAKKESDALSSEPHLGSGVLPQPFYESLIFYSLNLTGNAGGVVSGAEYL